MSQDNMFPPQKRRRYMPEEERESPSEMEDMVDSVEAVSDSPSSPCSSSFLSSFSSCSSYYSQDWSSADEDVSAGETASPSLSCENSLSSYPTFSSPGSPSSQPLSQQSEEGEETSQALPFPASLRREIKGKISELVKYLLYKYARKEPAIKEEMLTTVTANYEDFYHMIFSNAAECLLVTFGIELQPMEPSGQSYKLVPALGLTYDGCECDIQGLPKTGLLIRILCIIFVNRGHANEELLWQVLGSIGVCAGQGHFLCGDPENLVTGEFVQEGYLEFQWVPFDNPNHYVFWWGPRAHAEVRKMKILEYWSNLTERDPTSFPLLYEEALRDEIERAQAEDAGADEHPAMHTGSSAQEAAQAANSEDTLRQGLQ